MASDRLVGRTNSPSGSTIRVCGTAGGGAARRAAKASSSGGHTQCVGGVLDRPVAGAATEVAAHGVQVEAVGTVLALRVLDVAEGLVGVVGRLRVLTPVGPVVLGRHAADEAGRAVAALGPAADRHLLLHRVEGRRRAETLGGDDLLAVEGGRRDEAGVDRRPLRAGLGVVVVRPGDEDGARAALALGAALLGAGQADVAQPVQRRGVGGDAVQGAGPAVDRRLRRSAPGSRWSGSRVR